MQNRWSGFVAKESDAPAAVTGTGVRHTVDVRHAVEVLHGAAGPQQGLPGLAAGEAMARFITADPGVFWLGAHGGAGENTLADLLGGIPCHHRWPSRPIGDTGSVPADVFLVARQSHRGLTAAQLAARDWAAGSHPDVRLHGLVVIADAPGRAPRPLQSLTRITAGGVPRTWVLPWIEELRLNGHTADEALPRESKRVLTSLSEAVDEITSGRN